jgi:hypothetical protein
MYYTYIMPTHPPILISFRTQRLRDDAWIDKGTRYFKIDFVAYLRYDFLLLHVVLVAVSKHAHTQARERAGGKTGMFSNNYILLSHVNMSLLYCKFLSYLTLVSCSSIVLASAVRRDSLR